MIIAKIRYTSDKWYYLHVFEEESLHLLKRDVSLNPGENLENYLENQDILLVTTEEFDAYVSSHHLYQVLLKEKQKEAEAKEQKRLEEEKKQEAIWAKQEKQRREERRQQKSEKEQHKKTLIQKRKERIATARAHMPRRSYQEAIQKGIVLLQNDHKLTDEDLEMLIDLFEIGEPINHWGDFMTLDMTSAHHDVLSILYLKEVGGVVLHGTSPFSHALEKLPIPWGKEYLYGFRVPPSVSRKDYQLEMDILTEEWKDAILALYQDRKKHG